ncbi:cytochrome P450 2C8-like isoform X1 [Mytilus californianus]|uniref:cytochrome P450 2C8-like isoform X1 n=2 Tax=Mytilus californianus TaxID=6549 RepID=UPI002246648F|nr:cytochrome P450 2C8-like isoform X1 [Mytilus californianus]
MLDLWTVLLCLCVLCLYILWTKTVRNDTLPPGPPTVPFVGNLNLKLDNLPENFRGFRQTYGDVFSLILGSKTMVVVNGLEALKEIFVKNGDVTSERADSFITRELSHYKGIVSSSGSLWKEHRTFTLGALREFGFGKKSLESKIMEEAEVLMKLIEEKIGQPFNIRQLLYLSFSNITCSIVFGQRYEYTDKRFMSLLDKIKENTNSVNITMLATTFPFLQYIPRDPFGIKRTVTNADVVRKHLENIVKEHEETFDENNLRDYVDVFLKRMRSEKGNPKTTFDHGQLTCTIGDLFVAGTDTTSTALQWFIAMLINHPEVQDEMRKEINNVIGTSRYPCMQDKPKLPYTEAVLNEVLRFGCIAPFTLPHGLTKDFNYKGYVIPKGSQLMPNLHSVLYDPEIFDDPEAFCPTRFLDTDRKLINLDKVLAFGLGRRVCLGESLARMEFFLFATILIQRFKLNAADIDHLPSTKGKLGLTLAPVEFSFCAVGV